MEIDKKSEQNGQAEQNNSGVTQNAATPGPVPMAPPAQPQPVQQNPTVQQQEDPGKVSGIISLVSGLLGFVPVLPIVSIVLGFIAIFQSKKVGKTNVMGIIGLILGFIWTILGILFFFVVIGSLGTFKLAVDSTRKAEAQAAAATVKSSAAEYYAQNNKYPPSEDALVEYMRESGTPSQNKAADYLAGNSEVDDEVMTYTPSSEGGSTQSSLLCGADLDNVCATSYTIRVDADYWNGDEDIVIMP